MLCNPAEESFTCCYHLVMEHRTNTYCQFYEQVQENATITDYNHFMHHENEAPEHNKKNNPHMEARTKQENQRSPILSEMIT